MVDSAERFIRVLVESFSISVGREDISFCSDTNSAPAFGSGSLPAFGSGSSTVSGSTRAGSSGSESTFAA